MTTINEALSANLGPIQKHLEKLPEVLRAQAQSIEYERLRTRKFVRVPVLSGTAVTGVLTMGGDTGPPRCGPDQGYTWSVSLLAIEGLTAGATPDVVQIFRNSATGQGRLIGQLTGNQPVSTFGKGQMILKPGEALLVVSFGTFAATGECTLSGMAREIAAEREGELF